MGDKRIIIIDSPVVCGSHVEVLTEEEVEYLKDLMYQQDDAYELVYSITNKLGGCV